MENSWLDALRRWMGAVGLVKNPKRRFRSTAILPKHSDAAALRRSNQEKLKVAVLLSKASIQFLKGSADPKKKPLASLHELEEPLLGHRGQKRWRKAYTAIFASRAFSNPLKTPEKKSPVPSNSVVVQVFVTDPSLPIIDPSVLTGTVKEKNLDPLRKCYGVEGQASGLETNLENGMASLPLLGHRGQKRWRKACAAIFASRAFSNPLKNPEKKSPVPSDSVVVDVFQPHPSFPKIDPSVLREIVKQKNLDQLRKYYGVEGLAGVLETNLENRTSGDAAEVPQRCEELDGLRKHNGVEGLACGLEANLENGIRGDRADVLRRSEAFGPNTCKPPAKSFLYFAWEALRDPTALILIVLAALSFGFGVKDNGLREGWHDGGSIFVAIIARIAVSAIRNYWKSRQFSKSFGEINIQVDVVRSGSQQKVSIADIVVGDVVCLKSGDQVPADGLFIDGHSLHVEESSITGESDCVEVDLKQNNPFLLSGTKVADGEGRMLVTSVGMNTTWGESMSTISMDSNEQTPLTSRLKKLTSLLEKVGLFFAFLVFVVLVTRHFTGNMKDKDGKAEYNGGKTKASNVIKSVIAVIASAISIVDLAIPEKLSSAVTLTLAYWRRQMKRDHILIHNLSACETIGSATTICTDKTGMLTLNPMKVIKFWIGQELVNENGSSSIASTVVELLQQCVGLSTNDWVCETVSVPELEVSGRPMEKAIHSWAVSELGLDMEGLKQSCEIVQVEAFNSTKKISGTLMRKKGESTMNVHWKGAAEMVLTMCSSYYDVSANIKVLDDFERKKFDEIIQGMGASSLRCIAFAHKQVPAQEGEEGKENNLTLLGLVGLKDLCCPGVKKAVEECQYAGVNVKMITGDNIFTARAIATECGILKPNQDMSGAVIEGVEFRNYSPKERMEKVNKICVMARSSPYDKLLMVRCLRKNGHVVAVTGGGTNDALALKEADISLSMGIQGTEVGKESFDIVILDDNFGSIATVLKWGRCVYTNIQRFIQFQLTMNVAALVVNFVAAIAPGGVSLSAPQLLWLNLIMDTWGALALASGKPTEELMAKPPVARTEPVVTNVMWRNLISQAVNQIAVMLTLWFKGEAIFNVTVDVKQTLMFNVFVLCQVFNAFNVRELGKNVFDGIRRNKLFLGIVGAMVTLHVVMVEFMKKFADTERLTWAQWGVCVGFASVSWPIGWVVKWIPVSEKPFLLVGEGAAPPESGPVAATNSTSNSSDEVPLLPHAIYPSMPSELPLASATTNSGDKVPLLPQPSFSWTLSESSLASAEPESATNSGDEVSLLHHAIDPSMPSELPSASATNYNRGV